MSTKKHPASAHEPFEGNTIPAQFTVELNDYEAQLHITPVRVEEYIRMGDKQTQRVICGLSRQAFTVCRDGIIYIIRSVSDEHLFDPPYVHPDVVAQEPTYIRRCVLEKASLLRENIRFEMVKVVMMERGAELDIVFDLPEA